jgi:hypothetical protein
MSDGRIDINGDFKRIRKEMAVAYFIDYSLRDVTTYIVDIEAYLLKAKILKPEETALANNNTATTCDTFRTTFPQVCTLEEVFSLGSVQRLYLVMYVR